MGIKTGISYVHGTWNCWQGCQKVSEGCKNCLDPATLILYRDWTWRLIGDAKEGDLLIGFNETGKGLRKLALAEIQGVRNTRQPAIRVTTKQTEVICSAEHPFLISGRGTWQKPAKFTLTTTLRYIPQQTRFQETEDYRIGYIAGMTAGDGTMQWEEGWGSVWRKESPQCYWRVAVTDREILERLQNYLATVLNLSLEIKDFDGGNKGIKPCWKLETRSQPVLATIAAILRPRETIEYARGWLAGIFDAEGSHQINAAHASNLRISNTDTRIHETIINYAAKLGYQFKLEATQVERARTVRLYGDAAKRGAFLGTIQPALLRKVDGLLGHSISYQPSPVIGIEQMPVRDLIDIQTSTKTFYASGLATHNCYMYREKLRYGQYPAEVVRSRDRTFFAPRWWKLHDGARIMVCSWSDFFHIDADKWRPEAWKIIKELPQYNFLIPTKRPEHITASLPADWGSGYPNVWLGVSVENQEMFKKRVPILMDIPAKLRWLSIEPMLGPLSIWDAGAYAGSYIDWVVLGGESGPHHRLMENEWALKIVEECKIAMIPVYVKQKGGWPNTRHRLEDLPEGLKIREYPGSKDWPVSLG